MTNEGPTPVFATGVEQGLSAPAFDVVFVHGLSGDRHSTWTSQNGFFWPKRLADDFDYASIYLAGYDSNAFARILLGSGASIQDLAMTLADGLICRPRQAENIIFITHSLGGLIVKQMLRRCLDSADGRFQNLARKVNAVVFLGTPHQGAQLATAFDFVLRPFKSKTSQQLAYSDAALLDLNNFFANYAVREQIVVRSFYETDKTHGVQIVDRISANPNVYGAEPIAVQADHIDICKPTSALSPVYLSVSELLRSLSSPSRIPAVVGSDLSAAPSAKFEPSLPAPILATAPDTLIRCAELLIKLAAIGRDSNENFFEQVLKPLFGDMEAVHTDYSKAWAKILDMLPPAWERGTPRYREMTQVVSEELIGLRTAFQVPRDKLKAMLAAFDTEKLRPEEATFIKALIAYFPSGELAGSDILQSYDMPTTAYATDYSLVTAQFYRVLEGAADVNLRELVDRTVRREAHDWQAVCRAFAALQVSIYHRR